MILDASALVAMIDLEPGYEELVRKATESKELKICAASVLEASMVAISRLGPDGQSEVLNAIGDLNAEILPFDAAQLPFAAEAFVKFGKGRHPAALNFGDCMVYALAKATAQPIL